MIKAKQSGDHWKKKPGTCDQTGNHAPKFSWKGTPEGRTALIFILCSSYHLGYDDSRMANRDRPPAKVLYKLFVKAMPWFPRHYNQYRKAKIRKSGFTGKVDLFGPDDVYNRLLYMFAKPKHKGQARQYGLSGEHPGSILQAKGLHEYWVACSEECSERLIHGLKISPEEAKQWGARKLDRRRLIPLI
jgi:hypothetical protein